MAERRPRRSFTREFKARAVKRQLDGGKGLSEVATALSICTKYATKLAEKAVSLAPKEEA